MGECNCESRVWLGEKKWQGGSLTFLLTYTTHHICLTCQKKKRRHQSSSLYHISTWVEEIEACIREGADVNCSRRCKASMVQETLVSLKIYVITSSRRTQICPRIRRRRGCDRWVWLWEPNVKGRKRNDTVAASTFLLTYNIHHICLVCQK